MEEILKGLLGENIEIRASFKKFYKDKKNDRVYRNCYKRFDNLSQNDIDEIVEGDFEYVIWINDSYEKVDIGAATLLKIDEIYRVEYYIGKEEKHPDDWRGVDFDPPTRTLEKLTLVWDKRVNLSTQWIQIRCNAEEKQRWQRAAEVAGCPQLSSWIKKLLDEKSEKKADN